MTHGYWREGGPEFRDVNVMGVAHGTDKEKVLAHKAAIDVHLAEAGIEVGYKCLLGRAQRNQTFGDFALCLPTLV